MTILTLYSRPQCHLCDEMFEALTPIVADRARIEVVDISQDDELEAEYGLRIPVLKVGDQELCCYRLDREKVVDFLAGRA